MPVGGEWWRKVGYTFSLAWPPESVAQRRQTRRYEVNWDSPTLCRALFDFFEIAAYVVPEDQVVNCHQCGKRDITEAVASEIKKGEQVIDAAQAALASQDSASGSARVGLLMETHKEQFDRMKRMVAGLETLLHRCDDAIALFADY